MTSLFADQFGYRTPYGLGPLDTSVPSIGIRLPQGESNTPVNEGANTSVTGGASAAANAAAGAAEGLTAGQSNSGTVGQAGVNAAARQGMLNKLNAMDHEEQANGDNAASTNAPGSFNINLTKPSSGANANIPSPEWGVHQPKVTPQTYIDRTPTSPTSLPAGTHPVPVAGGGTDWVTGNSTPPQASNTAPAIFGPNAHVGSPGIWDLVKGTAGQFGHDLSVAGRDLANTFQNQNSFGQKAFEVPNTPGGYSTSTGTAGTIAQHGQPWSAYTNVPGSQSTYPGVTSPNYDVGIGEGPSNYGGYGQAAANDVGNDASHINWAQFFRSAANDFGDEG